jgi:hypothetical protein
MNSAVRRLMLATHLVCSVGWLGAVIAYIVLDLTVATSADPDAVRGAWTGMGLITFAVIVPFAVASVITGLAISVGTRWGLFRHWWVLISLVLTVLALIVLLVETRVIAHAAGLAADPGIPPAEILALPPTLPHSVGGALVLLVVQVLNVYKPQGLTPYGWRRQRIDRGEPVP